VGARFLEGPKEKDPLPATAWGWASLRQMNQLRCKNADARAKSGIRRAWAAEHPLQTDAAWNGPWRVHPRIQVRRHYSRRHRGLPCRKGDLDTTLLGPLATFTRPGSDQLALEFGQAAKHGEHQSAMSGRGIGPSILERFEAGAALADLIEHVEQVARSDEPSRGRETYGQTFRWTNSIYGRHLETGDCLLGCDLRA
jgi:hypothetical protein